MSNVLKVLTNLRSLRALAKELSLSDLEAIVEKITTVFNEKKEEEKNKVAELEERQAKLEKYKKLLAEDGIELSELLEPTVVAKKKTRAPSAPKYQYTVDGEVRTWSGQGKTPKAIQAQLAQGKSLSDFRIK